MSDTEVPQDAGSAAPPRRPRRRWLMWVAGILMIPIALVAVWTWITMAYTYSSGDRAGYVQKFSKKGWICKTWEGELSMVNIPGQAQERWYFTVRDDSIAKVLTDVMGQRVSLTYEEHRGVPFSCIGETAYFVTGVRPATTP
jgi:hypothetical protein